MFLHCIGMITLQMFLELIELWRCVAFDGCLYELFLQTCLPFVQSADRFPSRFLSPGFTYDFPEGFGGIARSLGGWSIMSTDTPWNCHRRILTLLVMFQGLLQMWSIASTWIRTTPELHSPSLIPNRGLSDWESLGMTSRLGILKPFFLTQIMFNLPPGIFGSKKNARKSSQKWRTLDFEAIEAKKTRRRGCVQDSWTLPHLALGFHQEAQS